MLRTDRLPAATLALFNHLAKDDRLREFTLIGGTAMSLQLAHRQSEDLDFWMSMARLNKSTISAVVRDAQAQGFPATLATPHSQIVQARINGDDLLAHAQDYVIGGVKVTFFARNDPTYLYFDRMPRVAKTKTSFSVMGEQGLVAMKSLVIHQRVRSRDLFDLKTFVMRGRQLGEIFALAVEADPACSVDYAKSVLIGDVPLDKADEGFAAIDVSESLSEIYAFFQATVDAYEQSVAMKMAGSG